jgi:hypothetical protein
MNATPEFPVVKCGLRAVWSVPRNHYSGATTLMFQLAKSRRRADSIGAELPLGH